MDYYDLLTSAHRYLGMSVAEFEITTPREYAALMRGAALRDVDKEYFERSKAWWYVRELTAKKKNRFIIDKFDKWFNRKAKIREITASNKQQDPALVAAFNQAVKKAESSVWKEVDYAGQELNP